MTQRVPSASPGEQSAGFSGDAHYGQLPLELGQYKLLGKLGEGGMGAVYRGLHKRLDRPVAIKVLPAWRLQDAVAVARFKREMLAVGSLDHPHIVRAMDAGVHQDTHYLVMELVPGLDIGEVVRRIGPLPVADACEIVRQAALGLQHAYENGLVHRDLKPSNLMLAAGPDGAQVKILDLGLALLQRTADAGQITGSDQIVGTIDYMAPEQADSTHTVDIRADLYSLGATLHKLLTRRVPFQGPQYSTTVKKLVALTTEDPPSIDTLLPDLPPLLVAIIHRLLARNPDERYATPQELAEALAPWTAGANLAGLLAAARNVEPQLPIADSSISDHGTPPFAASRETLRERIALPASPKPLAASTPDASPQPSLWQRRKLAVTTGAVAVLLVAGAMLLWSVPRELGPTIDEVADNESPVEMRSLDAPPPQIEPAAPVDPWEPTAEHLAFFEHVASLPPDEQVAAVIAKLKEVNPGYDGEFHHHRVESEQVTTFQIDTKLVRDIWPVRALAHLRKLECYASTYGSLNSLAPLAGLQLTELRCSRTLVADLSPLAGMPLEALGVSECPIADLSPLRGMPLKRLWIAGCNRVSDLSPLQGMQLMWLTIGGTAVADLSPLAGMPLVNLSLEGCRNIADLSPLQGMPLQQLKLGGCSQIKDLSVVAGMPLHWLDVSGLPLKDLFIVRGMRRLSRIEFENTAICDLTPLKDKQLQNFHSFGAPIGDYSLLKGQRITSLSVTPRLYDDELDAIMRSLPLMVVRPQGGQQAIVHIDKYWAGLDEKRFEAEAFMRRTVLLPVDRRVELVKDRLNEVNGGSGKARIVHNLLGPKIDKLALTLKPDEPVDISPVMALGQVRSIMIQSGHVAQDLSCLKFLSPQELHCPEVMVFTNQNTLRAIPTLAIINGQPAAEYIKRAKP